MSHNFPPEVNAPASRTYEHAKCWAKMPGVRVTVVTNHPHHPYGILYPGYVNHWLTREKLDGIDVIRVKTYLAPNAGFARRTLNYLFFMIMAVTAAVRVPRFDVVIATSPQFFCAMAGYLVSRLRRRPFIFELRDLWPETIVTVEAIKPGPVIYLLDKLASFLYHEASLIVPVTDAFKENLLKRGIPANKIQVIKNGVDLSFFQPQKAPQELLDEIGARGRFVASYIGTVGLCHALDKIIFAAERLQYRKDILFVIVGDGAQKHAIQKLVVSRGLQNVKVLPGVTKDKIRDYYALADINLVTLKKACLFETVIPSKIFEIMAMGRPILTTVDGECRQIIEAADCGLFVEPENVEKMSATILDLTQKREMLKNMGENGRLFVEERFSRDVLAQNYIDILRSKVFHSIK